MINLHEGFIPEVHFFNNGQYHVVDVAFLVFVKVFDVYGPAVLNDHMGLFDPRQMGLPDLIRIINTYGDNGTPGFFRDLKAAAVEGKKFIRLGAAASFGEDADRDAGFYFFDCLQNGLHPLLDILSVQKETVQIFHPVGQKRHLKHINFGDIACGSGNAHVGHNDIKIASVIAYVEYGSILRDILFTDYGNGYAGQKKDAAKSPVDNGKGAFVLGGPVAFSEEIFHDQKRNTENQEQNDKGGDYYQTYHGGNLSVFQ